VNRKTLVSLTTLVATGLLIYSSCTKVDTTDLGNTLIPAVDNVHTFDTVIDVITDNKLFPDSTRMNAGFPLAIGVIADDPEFGKTRSSAYFSISPTSYSSYPFVKKDSVVVDSVVLSLSYKQLYGDSLSSQKFEVYQIDPASKFVDPTSTTSIDTFSYKISTEWPVLSTLIGSKVVDFTTLNDSVYYRNIRDTIKTVNELRIPLDNSFAQMFINYDTAVQFKNDSLFHTAFKGLAVKVNEGASPIKNALAYFDFSGSGTRVTFYCRVQNNGKTDTIAPAFTFSGIASNHVQRDPAHDFRTYLENGSGNDDKIYLQGTPGSFGMIKIPGLENLSNRTVHRAELIIEKIPSAQENIYTQPPVLFIDAVNPAGDSTFTLRGDFVFTNQGLGYDLGSLEGIYKDNKYVFNISRHVQSIISKKLRNHALRIYAPLYTRPWWELVNGVTQTLPSTLFINSPVAAGRVVVGGGSHASQKMRLRIIYSKI
jgi:hypothetical protein